MEYITYIKNNITFFSLRIVKNPEETASIHTLGIQTLGELKNLSLKELSLFARVLKMEMAPKKDIEKLQKACMRQSPTLIARIEQCICIYFPQKRRAKEEEIKGLWQSLQKKDVSQKLENNSVSKRKKYYPPKTKRQRYCPLDTKMPVKNTHLSQVTALINDPVIFASCPPKLIKNFVQMLEHLVQPIASYTWDASSQKLTIVRGVSEPTLISKEEIPDMGSHVIRIPQSISFTLTFDGQRIQAQTDDYQASFFDNTFFQQDLNPTVSIESRDDDPTNVVLCIPYGSACPAIKLLITPLKVFDNDHIIDSKKEKLYIKFDLIKKAYNPNYKSTADTVDNVSIRSEEDAEPEKGHTSKRETYLRLSAIEPYILIENYFDNPKN